jgi:hypothetical protein
MKTKQPKKRIRRKELKVKISIRINLFLTRKAVKLIITILLIYTFALNHANLLHQKPIVPQKNSLA